MPSFKLAWVVVWAAAADLTATWKKEGKDNSACSWRRDPGHATAAAAWEEAAKKRKGKRERQTDLEVGLTY